VLEIGLRFFPVFSGMPVNRTSDVYSFTPNVTIQRSSNWDMSNPRKRRVNNAGFISDQTYSSSDKTPLIAIVGDSYIEAMQVDYSDTAEAHLLTKCMPHARVYSFGAQFAPLSQYLSWAQYASQTYQPKIMAVNIGGNDFDESLFSHQLAINNGGVPGMQFYDFSNDSTRLVTVPFKQENWLIQALRHSVLAQYLVRNVGVVNIINDYRHRLHSWGIQNEQSKPSLEQSLEAVNVINSARGAQKVKSKANTETPSEYVGNAKRFYSTEKLHLAKKAVDSFLSDLPKAAHLPNGSIVLTVDAERPLIYSPEGQKDLDSFFSVMRQYLIERAKSLGFVVIDLRLAMIKQFSTEGKRFEFPDDNHWNAVGHRLMADQLYQVPAIQAICQNHSH
jgi:lysophospholipase L1-like esterase